MANNRKMRCLPIFYYWK